MVVVVVEWDRRCELGEMSLNGGSPGGGYDVDFIASEGTSRWLSHWTVPASRDQSGTVLRLHPRNNPQPRASPQSGCSRSVRAAANTGTYSVRLLAGKRR